MREIKFRVWFPHEKSLYGGNFTIFNGRLNEIFQEPEIFLQYTGLKDVHGKEIYEGDIVADKENGSESNDVLYGSVFWEETAARFSVQWYWKNSNKERNPPVSLQSQASDVYVVGNIYENADILPQEGEE